MKLVEVIVRSALSVVVELGQSGCISVTRISAILKVKYHARSDQKRREDDQWKFDQNELQSGRKCDQDLLIHKFCNFIQLTIESIV